MKSNRFLALMVLLVALILAVPAFGQAEDVEATLYFQGAWARATASASEAQAAMPGIAEATAEPEMISMVSAVYLTLANAGGVNVRLVAAESPAANVVEIHEMQMNGDVMQMRPVEGGIDLPAGGVVVLEQGGLHIMLMDLVEPLVAGQAIPLTLTFVVLDDAGEVTDEEVSVVLAAPVLDEAPAWTSFIYAGAWARPAAADGVSAAYLRLLNIGESDDTLVSAAADVAGIVEIHEMVMSNDLMAMRPLEGGLPIAVGETAALAPGGVHIMLMDLPAELEEGTAFTLTLTFASGEELVLGVPVYDRLMRGV